MKTWICGFLLFFGGITLLYKVWWNCCFNRTSRLNTAGHITLVVLCACFIWLGMWLVASGFKLL
jgi:hypothetical protein